MMAEEETPEVAKLLRTWKEGWVKRHVVGWMDNEMNGWIDG